MSNQVQTIQTCLHQHDVTSFYENYETNRQIGSTVRDIANQIRVSQIIQQSSINLIYSTKVIFHSDDRAGRMFAVAFV